MQKLPGKLTVIRYNGRNGAFNSGKLDTDIGKFTVSDSALDQFAPGQYEGEFLITRIYIKTDTWQDNPFIKLMATVAQGGYLIHDAQERDSITPAVEPDDLDSEKSSPRDSGSMKASAAVQGTPSEADTVAASSAPVSSSESPQDSDASESVNSNSQLDELFGIELAPLVLALNSPIKLDPTVGRSQLRLQADHLKSLGYRFDASGQQWNLRVA